MSEITNTEELLKKCENMPKKYVTITDLRYVLDLYNNEEISFSRMVEILNENVKERIGDLEKQRNEFKESLQEIVTPIAFMRKRLKEDETLNGAYAYEASNSASYLRDIAQRSLVANEPLPTTANEKIGINF